MSFILPKTFFKENPFPELSAAQMTHFKMKALFQAEEENHFLGEIEQKMWEVDPSLNEESDHENELIAKASTPEQLVDLLRKVHGMKTLHGLCKQIIDRQDETAPIVIEKFLRSGLDYFIESSAIILANSDIKYTETLWNNYNNIRSPYAKSVACVIIGDKFLKDSEEFLYNEFLSFKQKYPFETYHEAPLFMIYTINDEY